MDSVLPKAWETAKICVKYRSSTYIITFENKGETNQLKTIELDGRQLEGNRLELIDDGEEHLVVVRIVEPT